MKKLIRGLFIAFAIVTLLGIGVSCSRKNSASNSSSRYTFGGSSTVAPIINALIPTFEKEKNVKVSYETLGSSVGLKQLQSGTLSLAASSRELKQSELDSGLKPVVIALDGLSIAINKDIDISNITLSDLARVFAGEISNWNELDGKDERIELIVRDETSGTYGSFKELVMDKEGKELTDNAIVARENGEVAIKIASTPGAIGYIGMAFNHIVEEEGGKVLTVDGVMPTEQTIKLNEYPLSRPLYVVTQGEADGIKKDFITYALSPEGQKVVSENGFININ